MEYKNDVIEMETIKKQFSKVTKNIRERKSLTQEEMAKELYLAGRQTVYSYETGRRFMKLPEFIEFVQRFDESVLINKHGLSLLDTDMSNKNNHKEIGQMEIKSSNFKLIEEKGDVSFYEDTQSQKGYQNVKGIGFIPVVDGSIEHVTVKSFGNIIIKYETNGCNGYSIWINNTCYEDNFWILEQAEEAVEELFLHSQKEKTILVMINNLESKLEDENISIDEFDMSDSQAFVSSMDDIFLDGGYFRCENFMDIAIPYALNFGELESIAFNRASWECIDIVFDKFKKESMKTVVCKKSDYEDDIIKFSSISNGDNSYTVTLEMSNKKLIFKEFYFGLNKPNLNSVIEAIKDDYDIYKESPNLNMYKEYIGAEDDEESILDYNTLKLDIGSMIEFFGEEYLNNLIS